jgi:hypothetical protein
MRIRDHSRSVQEAAEFRRLFSEFALDRPGELPPSQGTTMPRANWDVLGELDIKRAEVVQKWRARTKNNPEPRQTQRATIW